MTAEIITIGDELLIGQVVNTNQTFLAERLEGIGFHVRFMSTVGDELPDIVDALGRAMSRVDLVLMTGGLGPTHDDVTKKALCEWFETELVSHNGVRENIRRLLETRGMNWSQAAEEQTMVPAAAEILHNPGGTAPGMLLRKGKRILVAMPGVPYEMRSITDEALLPLLSPLSRVIIRHQTLRTTGITESQLSSLIGNPRDLPDGVKLAYLPSPAGVRLRISVMADRADSAERKVQAAEEHIRSRAGSYVYGTGNDELEEVVGALLAAKAMTLSVAESCTGGLIADRVTNVSGSSRYFLQGVVAYGNEAKISLLHVPEDLIARHGAVSREVAEAMASGARRSSGSSIGISTTGIAGPTGGSPEKPVGLVWIGYEDEDGVFALKFTFGNDRIRTKVRASQAALELLRRRLLRLDSR